MFQVQIALHFLCTAFHAVTVSPVPSQNSKTFESRTTVSICLLFMKSVRSLSEPYAFQRARLIRLTSQAMLLLWLPHREAVPKDRVLLQVLSDPRQKRFFKSKDMRDLFTLGDEYANATETSEIFASVNGEVTATLAAEQAPLPELNHAEGALSFSMYHESNHQLEYYAFQLRVAQKAKSFSKVICPAVRFSLALFVACWKLCALVLPPFLGAA